MTAQTEISPDETPAPCPHADAGETPVICAPLRYGLMVFGCFNVGLGIVGLFLPLMPTTVFLLIALWAFSKSSLKFHRWLYDHPRLGRSLREWHAHGVIPPRAKALALVMMGVSWLVVTLVVAESWLIPGILAACLVPVATFIATRPGRVVV